MGWRWGTKQSNKQKRGAEGKEEGGEEAQAARLVSEVNGGRVVNRRESHTQVKRRWDPGRHGGDKKESGRAEQELQAQKSAQQTTQHTAVRRFCPGRDRESITGAPRPQAGLGQETVGKAVVPTKVGSREYGYG